MLDVDNLQCYSSLPVPSSSFPLLFYPLLKLGYWSLQLLFLGCLFLPFCSCICSIIVRDIYVYNYIYDWQFDDLKKAHFITGNIFYFKVILSDISVVTLTFLCLLFSWYIIFFPFTITYMYLYLKYVSWIQYMGDSHFLNPVW